MWFLQGVQKQPWTRKTVLVVALLARLILVFYSSIHDYIFNVDFTDIDYQVFSDAAHHVANGRSPYERATYRYTPLLAWILVPNEHWRNFGKILFCLCDVAVGWLLFKMMGGEEKATTASKGDKKEKETQKILSDPAIFPVVVFWLANPLTAVISARGNADVLVCAAVLLTLFVLQKHRDMWVLSALVHGAAAVHLKIYPLIYLPSIFIHLSQFSSRQGVLSKIDALLTNVRGYGYALVSLVAVALIVASFYFIYGDVFLEEFLLYHIRRTDTRHNFSPYFLPLYLLQDDPFLTRLVGLGAFIPQLASVVYFAFRFHSDLPFCWFLTTFAFVSFNKVCTSQYFVWYIVFLPLIAERIRMSASEARNLIVLWFAGQGLWLLPAYLFEFQGWNTFYHIWAASLVFLLVNCYVLRRIIAAYKTKSE